MMAEEKDMKLMDEMIGFYSKLNGFIKSLSKFDKRMFVEWMTRERGKE